jgi:hypothetical protein
MADVDAAVAQMEDELGGLAARIGAVLGTDLQLMAVERAQARAGWLVAQLADGDQPDATAADLLALLWPDDPPLTWWRTPLGLLVAPTVAQEEDASAWSLAEAATVLGVTVGTVKQLGHRTSLERVSGGRISRRSVLARLVRLAAPSARQP